MSGTFDPFGSGLPADNDLPTDEMEAVTDALVKDVSGLKARIPDVPDLSELIPGTNLKRLPLNRPAPPLEEYVAEHVEAARRLVAAGQKSPQQFTEPTPGDDRVGRAEKYARWRWQGYKDGEIESL